MTLHFSPEETNLDTCATFGHARSTDADLARSLRKVVSKPSLYRRVTKRLLDVSLTLIAAPVVVPVILLTALLVMLDGHNPFYSQMRIGRDGRVFRLWKLRTMVHDAEALLESYLLEDAAAQREWKATQKLKNDPRITWIGRILRKSSIDELPQIWNVLTGDMSLVGPRPMMVCQKAEYRGTSYYRMFPGITGLWQISDRNECNFTKRVEYDELYDRIMSLKTDLWILASTVRVVLRGTGY